MTVLFNPGSGSKSGQNPGARRHCGAAPTVTWGLHTPACHDWPVYQMARGGSTERNHRQSRPGRLCGHVGGPLWVGLGWACVLLKRTLRSLRSFTFLAKELCVCCVLLRSLKKNVAFFAFFYILCKRTLHYLRSFTFFVKECCVLLRS